MVLRGVVARHRGLCGVRRRSAQSLFATGLRQWVLPKEGDCGEMGVFEEALKEIQDKVRNLLYVMTFHAEEEMEDDELSIYDVEHGVLSGEIVERQQDLETGGWKYLIEGETLVGEDVTVVAKPSPTGMVVIITVFLMQ